MLDGEVGADGSPACEPPQICHSSGRSRGRHLEPSRVGVDTPRASVPVRGEKSPRPTRRQSSPSSTPVFVRVEFYEVEQKLVKRLPTSITRHHAGLLFQANAAARTVPDSSPPECSSTRFASPHLQNINLRERCGEPAAQRHLPSLARPAAVHLFQILAALGAEHRLSPYHCSETQRSTNRLSI